MGKKVREYTIRGKSNTEMATNLARLIWRIGAMKCEAGELCRAKKEKPQLQGAHIFGVGAYPRLRADLRNGMCLCATCHRYYTSAPLDFAEFVKKTKYKKYLKPLKDRSNGPKVKVFWDEEVDKLTDILERIIDEELTIDEAREYESSN